MDENQILRDIENVDPKALQAFADDFLDGKDIPMPGVAMLGALLELLIERGPPLGATEIGAGIMGALEKDWAGLSPESRIALAASTAVLIRSERLFKSLALRAGKAKKH
jgi:hypothetical protein